MIEKGETAPETLAASETKSSPIAGINRDPLHCRVGDYRIVLEIVENDRVVIISKVLPRGEVYSRV